MLTTLLFHTTSVKLFRKTPWAIFMQFTEQLLHGTLFQRLSINLEVKFTLNWPAMI